MHAFLVACFMAGCARVGVPRWVCPGGCARVGVPGWVWKAFRMDKQQVDACLSGSLVPWLGMRVRLVCFVRLVCVGSMHDVMTYLRVYVREGGACSLWWLRWLLQFYYDPSNN